jgi:cytochrome d ubiquinol oxidase subunit II
MLEILWYTVIGFSILFYTVLDGFDLGVGALHLCGKTDEHRRTFLNAIGPVWDGNEVWIVVVMGALFAGFPNVYATVFSGFYTLLMFLIAGLMFRAVAIEFRSKRESRGWRSLWDTVFCLSSILVGFVLGLILGNVVQGIPVNAEQEYVGDFYYFFSPYSILAGLTAVALFTMHGAIYLAMKTEGEVHELVRKWIGLAVTIFLLFYILLSAATVFYVPHMMARFLHTPYLGIIPLLAFLSIFNIPYQLRKGNDGWAFISSCGSIALLLTLFGIGTYPVLVLSTIDPEMNNLTIFNTASSQKTLGVLLTVAGIGVPLVLGYMFWVYRIFKGKVKLNKTSY